jgi:hypothetical protein
LGPQHRGSSSAWPCPEPHPSAQLLLIKSENFPQDLGVGEARGTLEVRTALTSARKRA